MAFSASDLRATVARLREYKIAYELRCQPGYNTWQLFFLDPSGAKVKFDFAPEEPAPAAGWARQAWERLTGLLPAACSGKRDEACPIVFLEIPSWPKV